MTATTRPGVPTSTAFGNNGATNPFGGAPATTQQMIQSLGQMASTSAKRSSALFDEGFGGVDDVMSYLKKIVGGDRAAMLDAVKPEVGAVTDQYDTAYKSVVDRAPRGGGRTSAAVGLKRDEAKTVGSLIASARPKAVADLQNFISQLIGASTSNEGVAVNASGAAIGARQGQNAQNDALMQTIGQSLGTLLGIMATGGFKF